MKYENYAEALGFSKIGKVYVMESNGFKIYLRDWQYMVLTIPSFYIPLNKTLDKAELKAMEIASYNNAVAPASLGVANDTLLVTLADGIKTKEKTQEMIKAQIEGVTKKLKEDGFGPMETCPICKENAEYMPFGDHYCPMHEPCLNTYKEKLTALANKDQGFKPKYLISILLAVLGAVIGFVPALLLAIFKYNYFTPLLALVPILTTLGYFLGKAPAKQPYKTIVGVIVLLLMAGFLAFSLPYMANGKELSFKDYLFTNKWAGFRKLLLGTILAFGGFGGLKFLNKFRKNYTKELKAFED